MPKSKLFPEFSCHVVSIQKKGRGETVWALKYIFKNILAIFPFNKLCLFIFNYYAGTFWWETVFFPVVSKERSPQMWALSWPYKVVSYIYPGACSLRSWEDCRLGHFIFHSEKDFFSLDLQEWTQAWKQYTLKTMNDLSYKLIGFQMNN